MNRNWCWNHREVNEESILRSIAYLSGYTKVFEYVSSEFEGKLILDAGCGLGTWSFLLSNREYKCVGVDISKKALLAGLRFAKRYGYKVDFIVADVRYLPFLCNIFESAISYGVLEYLKGKHRKALKEMRRVINSGGKLIVEVPNIFTYKTILQFVLRTLKRKHLYLFFAYPFDVKRFSPYELRNELEICGFRVTKCSAYYLGYEIAFFLRIFFTPWSKLLKTDPRVIVSFNILLNRVGEKLQKFLTFIGAASIAMASKKC